MTLNIPTIGTKLELQQTWQFELQNEYRNRRFWETCFGEPCPYDWIGRERNVMTRTVRLPAGTVLTVDRIYIRKGAGAFDSVTFWLAKTSSPFNTAGRFWVRLEDVNRMNIEVVS